MVTSISRHVHASTAPLLNKAQCAWTLGFSKPTFINLIRSGKFITPDYDRPATLYRLDRVLAWRDLNLPLRAGRTLGKVGRASMARKLAAEAAAGAGDAS